MISSQYPISSSFNSYNSQHNKSNVFIYKNIKNTNISNHNDYDLKENLINTNADEKLEMWNLIEKNN